MDQQLILALVYEAADYKRALLLAEAAHNDGRVSEAEDLVSIVYGLMDAMVWPNLKDLENEIDDVPQPSAASLSQH